MVKVIINNLAELQDFVELHAIIKERSKFITCHKFDRVLRIKIWETEPSLSQYRSWTHESKICGWESSFIVHPVDRLLDFEPDWSECIFEVEDVS